MRDLQKTCKIMNLERKCSDGVEQVMGVLEQRLHNGVSPTDLWGKTVSFFTPKKTLLFHNGYSKFSRETLRVFPDSAEDVAPLCFQ
uniref:Si:ch73-21g5.7 n=1 Tax=Cyprinus carpio carpio TaxID=630221 RepID=A0A9J7ZKS1_CYPCA